MNIRKGKIINFQGNYDHFRIEGMHVERNNFNIKITCYVGHKNEWVDYINLNLKENVKNEFI